MIYLAYGSNMLARRLHERVPSARVVGVTSLGGWELRFHKRSVDGSGKCNIVPSPEPRAVVHGVVYELAAAEKHRLDAIEGLGIGYLARELVVAVAGERLEAFTYLAQDSHIDELLRPYRWYLDFVVTGARENGLPAAYVRRLLERSPRRDPDRGRAALNRRILSSEHLERGHELVR